MLSEYTTFVEKNNSGSTDFKKESIVKMLFSALVVALIVGFLDSSSMWLTRQSNPVSALWLSNGFLLGWLLSQRPKQPLVYFSACFVANVFANLSSRDPLLQCLILSAANSLEVAVPYLLLTNQIKNADQQINTKTVLYFISSAVVLMPAISGVISTFTISSSFNAILWRDWFVADALGMAIITPIIVCSLADVNGFQRSQAWQINTKSVLSLLLLIAVCCGIFYQSKYPFLFWAFPPLILCLFLGGLGFALIGCLTIFFIGFFFTYAGNGPLMLAHTAVFRERAEILQLYLLSTVLVALPVGILLARQKTLHEEKTNSEKRYRRLAENSTDIVLLCNQQHHIFYVSPSVHTSLNWDEHDFVGSYLDTFIHPDDRIQVEQGLALMQNTNTAVTLIFRVKKKSGIYTWQEAACKIFKNETNSPDKTIDIDDPTRSQKSQSSTGCIITMRDITARKIAEEELNKANELLKVMATTDGLTSLATRRVFDQTLSLEIKRCGREKKPLSLALIDVDFFKSYNDHYGHPAGDSCLIAVSKIISATMNRPSDVVARYGGEEIAVILPNTEQEDAARLVDIALRLLRKADITHMGGIDGQVTFSAGISYQSMQVTYPEHEKNVKKMLREADEALYAAKEQGRARHIMYRQENFKSGFTIPEAPKPFNFPKDLPQNTSGKILDFGSDEND